MFHIRPIKREEHSMVDMLLLVLFPKHYADKDGCVRENDILAFVDWNFQFYNFVILNNLKKGCQKRRKRRISIC